MNFKNKHSRGSGARGGCYCGGKFDKKVTGNEKRKYIDLPETSKSLSISKKSPKKDTKRWCKGKEGREHVTEWKPNRHYGFRTMGPNNKFLYEVLVCVNCQREMETRAIHIVCGVAHDKWGYGWHYKNRETGKYEREPFPCEAKAA
jgi:hypothetical protein